METKIVAVTEDNLQLVREGGAKWGMPRSVGWLRRCLFDPTVEEWTKDKVRGHMSIDEHGEVRAIQCYYYQPCYFRQKKIIGGTGAIMGSDSKYGEELVRVLECNMATQDKNAVGFGNCIANIRCENRPIVQKKFELVRRTYPPIRLASWDGCTSIRRLSDFLFSCCCGHWPCLYVVLRAFSGNVEVTA